MTPPHAPPRAVRRALRASLALLLALSTLATPSGANSDLDDLTSLSIEELMQLDVAIVSRSKRHFSELPAAVYVITGDEIRRSGHSSVPEALRMVPGLYVSRWTTTACG